MAFNYTQAAATAKRLIANFGAVGEIRAYNGVIDGVTGLVTDDYSKTVATLVTVPSVDSLIRFDDTFKESLATGKARVFLVAASGLAFAPEPGNCILHEGKLWEIGSGPGQGGVMPLNPAGTAVMFICGCMLGGRNPDPMSAFSGESLELFEHYGDTLEQMFAAGDPLNQFVNVALPQSFKLTQNQ